MKKFIAAFDSLRYSTSTEEYAIELSKKCHAHLVGVFLDDFMRHSYGVPDIVQYKGSFDEHVKELNSTEERTRDDTVATFRGACKSSGVEFSIHRDRNVAMQELLHESVFADLLMINESETLTRYEEVSPSRFIRELLADVQCPVIVVPTAYVAPEKVIFFYDGEPCSVYAIKMFSYLFPDLKDVSYELLLVRQDESRHLVDQRLLKEFMKRHYPDAAVTVLHGYPEQAAVAHLKEQKQNCLAVTGSYGRSRVSRWIRRSLADILIKNVEVPVFVAHNKS